MPSHVEHSVILRITTAIWCAGYAGTFLGLVGVIWNLGILRNLWVLRAILIVSTCGTAVSVLGVLKLLGAKIPPVIPFSGETDLLSFAAYFNIILYIILFLWVVHKAAADFGERVAAFVTGFTPAARARAAEKKGDYERAVSCYRKHLEISTGDIEAMRHYASCLTHTGRFRDAVSVLGGVAKRARGLNALTAGVEAVYVLRYRLADREAADKEAERLRKMYGGTPFERELEARLGSLDKRRERELAGGGARGTSGE